MAAILCHMTSKLLVQCKDNEINKDIKFCPSIPYCLEDIALSNNFNLINPALKQSVLNCTESTHSHLLLDNQEKLSNHAE